MFHAGCASLFERRASAQAGGARGGCVQEKYTRRDKQRTREILYFIVLCTPIAHLVSAERKPLNGKLKLRERTIQLCVEFCARNVFVCSSLVLSFKFALMEIHEKYKTQQREGFFFVFAQNKERRFSGTCHNLKIAIKAGQN